LIMLYFRDRVLKGTKNFIISSRYFLFTLVIFLAWIGFIAWNIFSYHENILYNMFFGSIFSGNLAVSELLSVYDVYERSIIYAGYAITLISTVIGLLLYLREKKNRSSDFLTLTLFFLPILLLATLFRFSPSTSSVLISHRAYEFGYFVIGAFSSFFFINVILKIRKVRQVIKFLLFICPVILIMIIGPMAGAMHPRTLSRLGEVISQNSLSMNSWIEKFVSPDDYIVGDFTIQVVLSGYGNSNFIRFPDLFYIQNSTFPENSSYVVTYIYMNEFYGTNLSKFENSFRLCNIYTNGIINIFNINNQTS
jgi:hypothetical protein